jgi:hypothetical protein
MSSQPDDLFTRLARAGDNAEALTPILEEIAQLAATPETFEFTHSIGLIAQSSASASLALGAWLGEARPQADPAQALLAEMNVAHLTGEALAPFEPGRLAPGAAILTGYRLAAFDTAPAVVLGWIVSCLNADLDPDGERLLPLLAYEARQFPRTTARLLENLDAALLARYPALDHMRQSMAQAIAALDAAPRLKELTLSVADREILRRYRFRQQRDIHARAEAQSVLMQFVTQAHFKYAREVTMQFDAGGVTAEQPVTLQEHTLEYEPPFLAMTDPLGQMFRRRRLMLGRVP